MSFHERKKERKEHYEKYIRGWKLVKCGACSGSGFYDYGKPDGTVPKCSACNGTGVERVNPKQYEELNML